MRVANVKVVECSRNASTRALAGKIGAQSPRIRVVRSVKREENSGGEDR